MISDTAELSEGPSPGGVVDVAVWQVVFKEASTSMVLSACQCM